MRTVAEYRVKGLRLAPLDEPPGKLPDGSRDVLYGHPIDIGYSLWDAVPKSAIGEVLDTVRGQAQGYVADETARAFKGCWNMGSWLIFEDGTGYHPLINREAAQAAGRPCWSDLTRLVLERFGQKCLCILTTDVKKRVWPRARVGVLGKRTDVFIHDAELGLSSVFPISWKPMVKWLDFIETLYQSGFSKTAINNNLLREIKTAQAIGLTQTIRFEQQLSAMRGRPEFAFSLIVAQKEAK